THRRPRDKERQPPHQDDGTQQSAEIPSSPNVELKHHIPAEDVGSRAPKPLGETPKPEARLGLHLRIRVVVERRVHGGLRPGRRSLVPRTCCFHQLSPSAWSSQAEGTLEWADRESASFTVSGK